MHKIVLFLIIALIVLLHLGGSFITDKMPIITPRELKRHMQLNNFCAWWCFLALCVGAPFVVLSRAISFNLQKCDPINEKEESEVLNEMLRELEDKEKRKQDDKRTNIK